MTHQPPSGQASPTERVRRIVDNAKSLAQQDVALFKQQMSATAAHGGKAAGAGGTTAVLLLYVMGFFGLAGGAALTRVVQDWAAWLIVGGVFLLLALIAAMVARSQATKSAAASQLATNQIKEDVQWAKMQIKP